MNGSWCQTKIAYLIGPDTWLCDQDTYEFFDIFREDRLPEGVEMRETGISGAAGFIIIFEKRELFTKSDIAEIENLIDRLNKTKGNLD